MKSRLLSLVLCAALLSGCAALGGKTGTPAPNTAAAPQLNNIKNICQMATLKCYYHNVAKSTKDAGSGLAHWGETKRTFWIDYTGIAEIGYNANQIIMEQNNTEITLTLPPPTVTCTVDSASWNPNSYVISEDSLIKKNPITADDQNRAINKAQQDMKNAVLNNPSLLASAETQARELIENYIEQVGRLTGVEYTVYWKNAEA